MGDGHEEAAAEEAPLQHKPPAPAAAPNPLPKQKQAPAAVSVTASTQAVKVRRGCACCAPGAWEPG